MKYFLFQSLLLKDKWLSPAFVGIDSQGIIRYLSDQKPVEENICIETIKGAVLPGFQNSHSHAFQYAMAGAAEQHTESAIDDFWSWREAMYACAETFTPDDMERVATKLYKHLLRNGYTSVAEFHYLHHDKEGKPYNNLAEMGERLISAAQTAGIRITLVPVWYQKGDFGKEPQQRQQRFISPTIEDYFRLLEASSIATKFYGKAKLGFGVHSLRAVYVSDIINIVEQGPKQLPFHLHAAEQLAEVERCIAYTGKHPVQWLLENLPLSERFHIVHCTHINDDEIIGLANSKANVVLCPGTEGNLGDGIFRLNDFANAGGNWSIGTDSHISLNPLEDLRWLDYAQRLKRHKRNTFADGAATLINKTFFAGKKAMGSQGNDYFETGEPFDAVVYNVENNFLAQAISSHLLSAIVYTADPSMILGTLVNGNWVYKKNG